MTSACELIDVELQVDRLESELTVEMPPHVRAFARTYVEGRPAPPAPAAVRRPSTLATARNACRHAELLDRGLALLRLAAPIAIEDDAAVVAARAAAPSWPAYAALAAARDAASQARFGLGAIELLHRLHGSGDVEAVAAAAPVPGWRDRDAREVDVDSAWAAIAARHGRGGAVRIERSATARPRAFAVAYGAEAIVVVPERVDTPAARFAVLHELGHALCALASPVPVPRVVDEAVAAYVARWMEEPGAAWHSPLAAAARDRRRTIAAVLDGIERDRGRGAAASTPPSWSGAPDAVERAAPPWSLWHDAGAQAAYVTAEVIADRLAGGSPRDLTAMIAAECARVDQATRLSRHASF